MTPRTARVVLVDDSPFVRRAFRRVLEAAGDVALVGEASDGLGAVEVVVRERPDVVLLDLGLPGLDGLSVLDRLRSACPEAAVVVVSAATQKGAEATLNALERGAFDVVDKSQVSTMQLHDLKDALLERIRAAASRRSAAPVRIERAVSRMAKPPSVIAIGASTGGPQAISHIAQRLSPSLPCPVVVVQHISASFVPALAARLGEVGAIPASVLEQGELLLPGRLYLAPGGVEVAVEARAGAPVARIRPAPRDALHAPSVDALFESVASSFGASATGVLLTGMGRDGAQGLLSLRKAGGFTIAEHPSTCAVYGMPRAATELGAPCAVLPLHAIPHALNELALPAPGAVSSCL